MIVEIQTAMDALLVRLEKSLLLLFFYTTSSIYFINCLFYCLVFFPYGTR